MSAEIFWLVPLGIAVGAFGTLIGAGGGFILVPVLLLIYPDESPERITSISLFVVFFNALSGASAYARMRRIDYRSGLIFAVATMPGAVLGAITTSYIPRRQFDLLFGVILILGAAFLLVRPSKEQRPEIEIHKRFWVTREITDADGTKHRFSFNMALGIGISLAVGYLSSLLGIGGGIIHVPALSYLLDFPVHLATATSHFVLAFTALTGTLVHVANGVFSQGLGRAVSLAIGALIGAQLGARLSTRIGGPMIIRGLALALGLVGVRILMLALS